MSNKKGTTKSNGRKQTNDKFYTADHIAEFCLSKLNLPRYSHIIEPSAGSGAFANKISKCIALDIEPESDTVLQQNFFDFKFEETQETVLVVGNPPFGIQNNLAIKFFNHASTFADTIAFILPRSFRKDSIKNKLNLNFILKEEYILPKNSFRLNNEPYDVPCVFQIWVKTERARTIIQAQKSKHIQFVKKDDNPDFYIQRIGGNSGKIGFHTPDRSEQSNYFIKIEDIHIREQVYKFLHNYNWDEIRKNAVGPRSISKTEISNVLHENFPELF